MTPEQALGILCQIAARTKMKFADHMKWQAAAQVLRQAIAPTEDGPETDTPADADSPAEP